MVKLNPSFTEGFFYEIRKKEKRKIKEMETIILTIRKCEKPFFKRK